MGYYRKFILGYAKIVQPLSDLLKKDTKFVWSEKCESVFMSSKIASQRHIFSGFLSLIRSSHYLLIVQAILLGLCLAKNMKVSSIQLVSVDMPLGGT